jgi:hypothetical protein
MWTACPTVLDAPVTIMGLEPEDFAIVAIAPLFLAFVLDAAASLLVALALGWAVTRAKRGRPPGAMLHALHGWELVRLPGLLRPTVQRYSAW